VKYHLSYSSIVVMRLDNQILLKSPPLTLLAGSAPWPQHSTVMCISSLLCFQRGPHVPRKAWAQLKTACALYTAGLTQTCAEWSWLIIKAVCAETSNPQVTSSINVLFWPLHAASPTPSTKIWLNTFAFVPFRPYRIILSAVCIRQKKNEAPKASVMCRYFAFKGAPKQQL